MIGVVKWYNESKGFGFILCEGVDDVFVHYSEIQSSKRTLERGQQVEFELTTTEKGIQASKVRKVAA